MYSDYREGSEGLALKGKYHFSRKPWCRRIAGFDFADVAGMAYLETGFSQTRGPFTRARLAASGILCYAQNDDQETENDRKNFM